MFDWIGTLAGILTTCAFLPQVLKVWRTRSVTDISLGMYVLFITGVVLWIVYGLHIRSAPVVAANGTTLLLAASILVAKLRFRPQARGPRA